jgi:hypothetical protein
MAIPLVPGIPRMKLALTRFGPVPTLWRGFAQIRPRLDRPVRDSMLPPLPLVIVSRHQLAATLFAVSLAWVAVCDRVAASQEVTAEAHSASEPLREETVPGDLLLEIESADGACPPLYVTAPDSEFPLMTPVFSESGMSWPGGGCTGCGGRHGGCNACQPRWFASASGLVMTRTLPAGVPVSTRAGNVMLTSADAAANWPGGIDLRLGRWFGQQQRHGVEVIYWGLYNIGSADIADGGGLDAIPSLASSITVGGASAASSFANAASQRVGRNDLVNDAEVNWLYAVGRHPELLDEQNRWSLVWLAGFRFFQLQDALTITSPSDATDPLILDVTTNNSLLGGQLGARVDWRFAPRFRLAAVPKFLLAGNAVSNVTTLETAGGTMATYTPGGDTVAGRATGSTFAYLGSVDSLIAWDVTDRWSLWIGYRVVGVGNIMNADSVWPATITDPGSIALIDTDGYTIVHGGFAGFESRF